MAAESPYEVLGVKPDAKPEAIRKAYRKLAKEFHPDLNPGKPAAEARFKTISAAYDLLSDPEKRARYDRGEIDETGAERPRAQYRPFAEGAEGWKYHPEGAVDLGDLEDLFAAFGAGARPRAGGRGFRARGFDRRFSLSIGFVEAATGGRRRLQLSPEESLEVTIPAGIETGQVLRLKGKGGPGLGGGEPGDALIEVTVEPHPLFRRVGNDIHLELPISLSEAVLGARVPVPTVGGTVTMTIPKASDTGTQLRLRGRGVRGGDQYVTLKVVLGRSDDPELAKFVEEWAAQHPFDPRRGTSG
jgi:DnaJ-class molecular chaperone